MSTKDAFLNFVKNHAVVLSILGITLVSFIIIITSVIGNRIIITLNGDSEETIEYGENYYENGASATYKGLFGSSNEELSVYETGTVDEECLGSYSITYKARKGIFSSSKKRKVKIVDTTAPTITLLTKEGHYTNPGEKYIEEGYIATDNYDGDITDKVKRVENNDVITYSVSDSSGNERIVTRTIIYNDGIPPKLTLNGSSNISINAGDSYNEPGFTSLDDEDGDLTDQVSVSGNVDTFRAGTYTLVYSSKDKYGNESVMERTVTVNPIKQADTVSTSGKIVYLTFDDGPGAYTQQLLDTLAKYNVKVTFFVTNMNGAYSNLLSKEASAGHTVAIHSASHNYSQIYSDRESYFSDLNEMSSIIEAKTGTKPKLIRFPGGSSNTVSKKYCIGIMSSLVKDVTDQGYRYYDWNVSSGDAGGTISSEQVFQNVINGIQKNDVSVVLQHDTKSFSVNAVESIIVWGLSNGYTFLPLTPSTPEVHHSVSN